MKRLVTDEYVSALFENGDIRQLYINDEGSLCGGIYAGIVEKILPNQMAFVNIGRKKNSFLYLNDKKQQSLYDGKRLKIKQGDSIIVQVEKDETDLKGAAVTVNLNFSGKYAVVLTSEKTIGISKKIYDEKRRDELKSLCLSMGTDFGIILRTSCENAEDGDIKNEIAFLCRRAEGILKRGSFEKPPVMLEGSESQTDKIIRDILSDEDEIVSDSREILNKISRKNTHYYDGDMPMRYYYGITAEIEKALKRKVWLKSGGFIIFDYAEACTVIDVNSGKNILKSHESNALKTNIEAARETIRQIILRNISGMIFIDFIDMKDKENIEYLQQVLKDEAKKDFLGMNILGMTELNVMQITRKKTGRPLYESVMCQCPICRGRGMVYSEWFDKYKKNEEI